METVLGMKLIGFIKEYNDIPDAMPFAAFVQDSGKCHVDVVRLTKYLEMGELLLGWMGYFKDLETGELIDPDSYFTDGCYIWPAYFKYYLAKYPKYKISTDFMKHVIKNNYEHDQTKIARLDKAKWETWLSNQLSLT